MKLKTTQQLRRRQRQISSRLRRAPRADRGPVLGGGKATYELGERVRAIGHGGIGAAHNVVTRLGLAAEMDEAVRLLKVHRPYHESDHVLNIAYSILFGGQTLDDIERLRTDEVHLDALGVDALPDPTTAIDMLPDEAFPELIAHRDVHRVACPICPVRMESSDRFQRARDVASDVAGDVEPVADMGLMPLVERDLVFLRLDASPRRIGVFIVLEQRREASLQRAVVVLEPAGLGQGEVADRREPMTPDCASTWLKTSCGAGVRNMVAKSHSCCCATTRTWRRRRRVFAPGEFRARYDTECGCPPQAC